MSKNASAVQNENAAAWWHTRLQSGLLLVLLLTASTIPRLDVTLFFLLGILTLFYFWRVRKTFAPALKKAEQPWFLAVLFALSAYLFLTAFWALDPLAALDKAGYFLVLIAVVLLASRAFEHQSTPELARAARFIVWGAVIGTLIGAFEFATDHFITRLAYKVLPFLEPSEKTIEAYVEMNGNLQKVPESRFYENPENVVIRIHSAALNRNLSLMLLLFWPALFLAMREKADRMRLVKGSLMAAAAVVAVIASESQTAQIALVLGAFAYAAAWGWPAVTHWGAVAVWCAGVALALPLAAAPYKAGWHEAGWLFASARDRIVIWGTTAERAVKTPALGIGVRSTRIVNRNMQKTREKSGDLALLERVGLHTHNHFLQIWYELGVIGAALVLAAGLGLLQRMRALAGEVRPYAYAAFACAVAIAAFGWGLWQTWLLAGYAFAILMMRFAIEFAARAHSPRPRDAAHA